LLPLLVEQLNPAAVAVAYVQDAAGIDDDLMRQRELAGTAPIAAPRLDELAISIEMDDAPVAVPVGDEDVPVGRDRRVRRPIESCGAAELAKPGSPGP
jgi:hypothetical protein